MACQRTTGGLITGGFIVWIGLSSTLSSALAGGTDGFTVAGVTIGMDYDSVRRLYPAARIKKQPASCYYYGKAVRDPSMTRRVLQHRGDSGSLTMTFTSPRSGGQLFRIDYDRRVDPAAFNFRELLDRFTERYGPHDRIMHRRKMEPAGRIIGFEWHKPDDARLRLVVRHDHHAGMGGLHLNILASSRLPDTPPDRQPALCASTH